MTLDYRQIQMLRAGGHVKTSQGGSTCKIELSGTAEESGIVAHRYALGVGFSSTEASDLLFLAGTAFVSQWRNVSAGGYNWNFNAVAPRSDKGTALTCLLDSNNGTVSLNLFYD